VTVDGSLVAVSAVDGQNGTFTLATAPIIGAIVLATYYTNRWQDTFDYLPVNNIVEVVRVGTSPGRNDFTVGLDFVIEENKIQWGNSFSVASGVTTSGTTPFEQQIQPYLYDNKVYVTTFREMAQALRGIYGELLINSISLKDNSRRDWFLPDQHSMELNNIITDFMLRLHNYRYCASRYFRSNPSKKQDDLKKALDELVNIKDNAINYNYFYEKEKVEEKEVKGDLFSEQDIPHENQSIKKYYDILMKIIEEYFDKTKNRVLFLKLRAYIVNHFKKK